MQIARDNNFIRLGEVTSGPVYQWMLRSGLTIEEIALVQLPDSREVIGDIDWKPDEDRRINDHILMTVNRLTKDTRSSLVIAARRLAAALKKKTA